MIYILLDTVEFEFPIGLRLSGGDNSVHNNDVARDINRVVRSVERFAKGLQQLQVKLDEFAQQSTEHSELADIVFNPAETTTLGVPDVRVALMRSRARPTFGAPDLFGNALWSLLLELLLAEMSGEAVPVSNACISLGGPQSTALRLLNCIEKRGLVVSHPDPHDGRRRLLCLTEAVKDRLVAHLASERPDGPVRFRMNMKLAELSEDGPFQDEIAVLRSMDRAEKPPIPDAVNNDTNSGFRKVS